LRVEELIELNNYSLVQYKLPDTGELVPLLQPRDRGERRAAAVPGA
jgi:hypothetical protein